MTKYTSMLMNMTFIPTFYSRGYSGKSE